jgi:hypothetical protein
VAVDFIDFPAKAAAGSLVPIRVRLTDPSTREPRNGLADVRVLYHAVPGGPKSEAVGIAKGDGVYEAAARVDRPGAWYFFVSVPSLKVKPSTVPYRGLLVEAQGEKSP